MTTTSLCVCALKAFKRVVSGAIAPAENMPAPSWMYDESAIAGEAATATEATSASAPSRRFMVAVLLLGRYYRRTGGEFLSAGLTREDHPERAHREDDDEEPDAGLEPLVVLGLRADGFVGDGAAGHAIPLRRRGRVGRLGLARGRVRPQAF